MSSNEENNVGGQLQGNQEGHELGHIQIMAKIPGVEVIESIISP